MLSALAGRLVRVVSTRTPPHLARPSLLHSPSPQPSPRAERGCGPTEVRVSHPVTSATSRAIVLVVFSVMTYPIEGAAMGCGPFLWLRLALTEVGLRDTQDTFELLFN